MSWIVCFIGVLFVQFDLAVIWATQSLPFFHIHISCIQLQNILISGLFLPFLTVFYGTTYGRMETRVRSQGIDHGLSDTIDLTIDTDFLCEWCV
jgi:hypothetical protein